MEFKIDTKDIYTHITPDSSQLDANLTEALGKKLTEMGQSVRSNFIIDLSNCVSAHANAMPALVHLHADCYTNSQSLVFTGVNENIMEEFKKNNIDNALNITPTLAEAIDIISMEILERDLLSEE